MSDEHMEKTVGRFKEAAGAIAGDSRLKNRGRAEQAKASVKKAADQVQEALRGRRDAPARATDRDEHGD
jgi:uncharacterized protein YjbJ (UPF0337 family)